MRRSVKVPSRIEGRMGRGQARGPAFRRKPGFGKILSVEETFAALGWWHSERVILSAVIDERRCCPADIGGEDLAERDRDGAAPFAHAKELA